MDKVYMHIKCRHIHIYLHICVCRYAYNISVSYQGINKLSPQRSCYLKQFLHAIAQSVELRGM